MTLRSLLALGAVFALIACGEDDKGDGDQAADECPTELSYAKTAEPFLEAYCLSCHSEATADAVGDGHVFETEALVREHGHIMYEQVATGAMPKSGPKPSEAEKTDFLDWLDCSGASAEGDGHTHTH